MPAAPIGALNRFGLVAVSARAATVGVMDTVAAAQRITALVVDLTADPAEAAHAVGVLVASHPPRETLIRVRAELDVHAARFPAAAAQVRMLMAVVSGALSTIPFPSVDADLAGRVLRALAPGDLMTASEVSDLARLTRGDVTATLAALTARGEVVADAGPPERWRLRPPAASD